MSRLVAAALLSIGAFVLTVSAASADLWRPVTASCVRAAALAGCTTATNAGGLASVAVAPDGKTAYGAGSTANTLLIFNRDAATGQLAQRTGATGCFGEAGAGGCTQAFGLSDPDDVVVSGDGRSVYVASRNANSDGVVNGTLAVFKRDTTSGALTYAGCFSSNGASNGVASKCTVGRGMTGARDVELSPDQRTVYAGPSGSIATFNRDVSGGSTHGNLTQLAGTAGCIATTLTASCDTAPAIGLNGRQFSVSPDGNTVYAAGASTSSLVILDRNTGDGVNHGALSQEPGTQSCFGATTLGGQCTLQAKLTGASAAVSSADGRQLYVSTSNGVLTFTRSTSGALTFQSCVNDLGNGGCSAGKDVTSLGYLALSPDGQDLIATVEAVPTGLVALSRDSATGDLSQRSASSDVCVSTTGLALDNGAVTAATGGCVVNATATGSGRIAFPSNTTFTVGALTPGSLLTFKRDFAPVCPDQAIDVTRDTSVPISFGCSDRNGDPMTYTISATPVAGNLGAIDAPGARVFYNPFGGYTGGDAFKFRAISTGQLSNVATATLNVVPPPGSPGTVIPLPAVIDKDGDGYPANVDCNDSNPAIRPGTKEIKGNNVDENCDSIAEPFPTLAAGVVNKWDVKGSSFRLTALQVTQQFPKGWKAKIQCSGSKCPFKSKTLKAGKVSKGASTIIGSLSTTQRKFRAGQTIEVWVSAPSFNTKVARLLLRKGKIPTTQPFCVVPGQTKPQKACT